MSFGGKGMNRALLAPVRKHVQLRSSSSDLPFFLNSNTIIGTMACCCSYTYSLEYAPF